MSRISEAISTPMNTAVRPVTTRFRRVRSFMLECLRDSANDAMVTVLERRAGSPASAHENHEASFMILRCRLAGALRRMTATHGYRRHALPQLLELDHEMGNPSSD